MILTLAFTRGFQDAISQKVFNMWGDIRVERNSGNDAPLTEELPVERNDTVLRTLRANPDIATIQAFATKSAVIRSREGIQCVLMKGVEKSYDFSRMDGFLKSGHWPHFPDSGYSKEIVISTYAANQLKIQPGKKLLIYFIQTGSHPGGQSGNPSDSESDDGPHVRVRQMIVCGLFKTGIEDYDKSVAIGDLRLIQRLNDWQGNQIGGYEIFTRDYRQAPDVDREIDPKLPQLWSSVTTVKKYPNIFDWLNLQNITIAIVLIIMVVVATLNLVTCLIILVLERTRMIGVLKSIGTPNALIQRIFLYQGGIITIFGLLLGNTFGLAICWAQNKYGFITLPEDAYFISKAVVKFEWWHFVLVNGGTFLICFLVLMIPTLIVRKVQPVRAIQFR